MWKLRSMAVEGVTYHIFRNEVALQIMALLLQRIWLMNVFQFFL